MDYKWHLTATINAASFCTPSNRRLFQSGAGRASTEREAGRSLFRLFSRFGFDEGVADTSLPASGATDHFLVNPYGQHFYGPRVGPDPGESSRRSGRGDAAVNWAAFAIHLRYTLPDPTLPPPPTRTRFMVRAGRRSACPRSSRRTPASFRTTAFRGLTGITTKPWKGSGSPRRWASTKRLSCATTDCSPWAIASMKPCGSSPWSGAPLPTPGRSSGQADPHRLPKCRLTASQIGTHEAGWFQFQPLRPGSHASSRSVRLNL